MGVTQRAGRIKTIMATNSDSKSEYSSQESEASYEIEDDKCSLYESDSEEDSYSENNEDEREGEEIGLHDIESREDAEPRIIQPYRFEPAARKDATGAGDHVSENTTSDFQARVGNTDW